MTATNWKPTASFEVLRARAALLNTFRIFFAERDVLEVSTPLRSRYATVDRHIDSFATDGGGWLQTSPEFAMKRLLAAGSGPIWQAAPVFRRDEQGRDHNPEFTMLEWYRPGFDHLTLMDEVEALLRRCGAPEFGWQRYRYRDVFVIFAGFDPFKADAAELRRRLGERGIAEPEALSDDEIANPDFWLDLWMSLVIGPQLGPQTPAFVYDFPASQAALARVRDDEPPVAERFELFWHGVELANGFHELTDAAEQQRRFEADQQWRAANGRAVPPYDAALIAALQAGLPPCAGVALGADRLLMQILGCARIEDVIAFPADRA
ncbi:EF-P lysine aminoacylase EpmA [Solimonas marina]|uniref:EF-P lysine aminoacylase GenX n=1 Tax=Solimonas marina TaxID=2714601 RepID=A0A969W9R2_9GAMM|nr:EF-P lysine aminoacylase EpmA [Solimonas marina]NKF23252.1 EF-P lysine aminoacylase GenX [Solimonas marina]